MNIALSVVFMATFLHSMFIDFNSFFASVEQLLRPELRGKPVVVAPLMAETTCCIAASAQAKPFGIKTGTPVHEARRLCPGLVVLEARPEHYIKYHNDLNDVIVDCGVTVEVESIDEVHCPLWGEWMEVSAAQRLAVRVKQAIATRVSPVLTCSIGLAPNRFLAKTASDMKKPDGLVTILPDDLPQILHPLELRDLYGIGPRTEIRLRRHAIDSVEQLCTASEALLHSIWGSIEGERFHAALHGKPTFYRSTERRSLGHSHILPPDLRHERGARSVLHRLTQKAAMRLRSHRCVTSAMSIFIKAHGYGREWDDEIHFTATQDTLELLRALDLLWQRRPPRQADAPLAVGVNFFGLKDQGTESLPLLDRAGHARRKALLQAVDQINLDERNNRVHFAGAHGATKYTPMRIAFTRIPDPVTER